MVRRSLSEKNEWIQSGAKKSGRFHIPFSKRTSSAKILWAKVCSKNAALPNWAPKLLPSQAACRTQLQFFPPKIPKKPTASLPAYAFHRKLFKGKEQFPKKRRKQKCVSIHNHIFIITIELLMDKILQHSTWQSSYPPTPSNLAAEARCPAPKTDTKTCLEAPILAEHWGTAVGKYLFWFFLVKGLRRKF